MFIPHLHLALRMGCPRRNFAKMFDTHETRMIGLPCGEETDTVLSRYYRIPQRDGQTDGPTDRIAISISRVSVLTRDENVAK